MQFTKEHLILELIGRISEIEDQLMKGLTVKYNNGELESLGDLDLFLADYFRIPDEKFVVQLRNIYNILIAYPSKLDRISKMLEKSSKGHPIKLRQLKDLPCITTAGPILKHYGNTDKALDISSGAIYGIYSMFVEKYTDSPYNSVMNDVMHNTQELVWDNETFDHIRNRYGRSLPPQSSMTAKLLYYTIKYERNREIKAFDLIRRIYQYHIITNTPLAAIATRISEFICNETMFNIVITVKNFYLELLKFLLIARECELNGFVAFVDVLSTQNHNEDGTYELKIPTALPNIEEYGIIIGYIVRMQFYKPLKLSNSVLFAIQLVLRSAAETVVPKVEPKDSSTEQFLSYLKIVELREKLKPNIPAGINDYFSVHFKLSNDWTTENFNQHLATCSLQQLEAISKLLSAIK